MNITTQKQLVFYAGSVTLNISSLPNVSKIDTIYRFSSGSPISWVNGYPEFLQGFTTLEPNTGYLIISKDSTTYPYVLTSVPQIIPNSITISSLLQIALYSGVTKDLSTDTAFTSKVDKIFKYVNNSPQDWTNGVPEFLQGFTTLDYGVVYLFDSNNVPYTLYSGLPAVSTTTTVPPVTTSTTTTSPPVTTVDALRSTFDLYRTNDTFPGATQHPIKASFSPQYYAFIKDDGRITLGGKCPFDSFSTFKTLSGSDFVQVSAGINHLLALKSNGTLWAYGLNTNGEVGDNTQASVTTLKQIGTDTNWVKIAAGNDVSYGIKSDGSLWHWGRVLDNTIKKIPTQWYAGPGYQDVYCGYLANGYTTNFPARVIALTSNNFVFTIKNNILFSAGNNSRGQLGLGTTTNHTTLQQVMSISSNRKVECGGQFTLILSAGALYGCGDNTFKQLLPNSTLSYFSPTLVDSVVTDMSAGIYNSQYIKNGQIFTQGKSSYRASVSSSAISPFSGGSLLLNTEWSSLSSAAATLGLTSRRIAQQSNNFKQIFMYKNGYSTPSCFSTNLSTPISSNSPILYTKGSSTVGHKTDLTTLKTYPFPADGNSLSAVTGMLVDNEVKELYALEPTRNLITIYSLETDTQIGAISIPTNASFFTLGTSGLLTGIICVLHNTTNKMTTIDTGSRSIISTIQFPTEIISGMNAQARPFQAFCQPNGDIFISLSSQRKVVIYGAAGVKYGEFAAYRGNSSGSTSRLTSPRGIAYDPSSQSIITSHDGSYGFLWKTLLDPFYNIISQTYLTQDFSYTSYLSYTNQPLGYQGILGWKITPPIIAFSNQSNEALQVITSANGIWNLIKAQNTLLKAIPSNYTTVASPPEAPSALYIP